MCRSGSPCSTTIPTIRTGRSNASSGTRPIWAEWPRWVSGRVSAACGAAVHARGVLARDRYVARTRGSVGRDLALPAPVVLVAPGLRDLAEHGHGLTDEVVLQVTGLRTRLSAGN